jgi:hypothetical protein
MDTVQGRAIMKTVRFATTDAVFSFSLEDVTVALKGIVTGDEANELMDFLTVQQGDVIEIPPENRSFLYLTLNLLASNKRTVFCKACRREYQAHELTSFPVGAGENPLKVQVGYSESLLKRILGRQKRVPLFGGKGYGCPEGHELIGLVTWRT